MNPLLIGPLFEMGSKIIDKFFPDTAEADKKKAELMLMVQQGELQVSLEQIKTNQLEASSGSKYAAGWRPSIGYICALGLAYNFIIYPLLTWWSSAYRPDFTPPPLISDSLMELTLAMLGMAGLRSWEKWKGIAR